MENDLLFHWSKPSLGIEESDFVAEAMKSTWVSGGINVEIFEEEIARKLEVRHVIAVNNGTSALLLAMVSAGLKAGDTIIVPAFGFMAAANISINLNLKVYFADVYRDSWNLNLNSVPKNILKKAKAVVGIDNYGNPCDVSEILDFANKFDLIFIQDCAESIGSKTEGKFSGTFKDIGSFSFHATKLITTGEGGAIATNNDEFARIAKLYRSHGMDRQKDYLHQMPGNNLRLSNILAAIGVAQIRNFDYFCASRKEIDSLYRTLLTNKGGLDFQFFNPEDEVVPWSFPILLGKGSEFRDEIQLQLRNFGIETRTGFKSPKYLSYFNADKSQQTANYLSENILSLPSYPGLKSKDIEYIADSLLKLL